MGYKTDGSHDGIDNDGDGLIDDRQLKKKYQGYGRKNC
jgi:hypothetical protein